MKTILVLFLLTASYFVQAQKQKVVLSEDFSNNKNNWPIYMLKNVNHLIYNGKMVIDTDDSSTYNIAIPVTLNADKNYSISLTAVHTGGVDNNAYGLIFGGSDASNYYSFYIASSGYFRVGKSTTTANTDLIKWTTTPLVKVGNYVDNVLEVTKEGPNWKFTINGQSVATIPALPFLGNNIGVSRVSCQRIEFDDLKVVEY